MRLRLATGVLLAIFVLLIGALFGALALVMQEEPVMNSPEYTDSTIVHDEMVETYDPIFMPPVGPQFLAVQEEEEPPKELTPRPDPPEDWEGDVPGIHAKTPEACVYYGMCLPLDAEGVEKWNASNPGQRGYSCPGHAGCHIGNKAHANTCWIADEDGRLKRTTNHGPGCGSHCREQCCKCCGSP